MAPQQSRIYFKMNKSLLLIISFYVKRRKCDLLGCTKDNPLWNVFRGCGHSFHIECIMPEITTCPVCLAKLLAKIEDLGKTANNAVSSSIKVNVADEDDDDHTSDDEESGEDEQADEECQNETSINNLLTRISLWKRAEMTQIT